MGIFHLGIEPVELPSTISGCDARCRVCIEAFRCLHVAMKSLMHKIGANALHVATWVMNHGYCSSDISYALSELPKHPESLLILPVGKEASPICDILTQPAVGKGRVVRSSTSVHHTSIMTPNMRPAG